MYVKCNRCGKSTWVDDPEPNAYTVDTGCPCGADFTLHCEGGRVKRFEGCKPDPYPLEDNED